MCCPKAPLSHLHTIHPVFLLHPCLLLSPTPSFSQCPLCLEILPSYWPFNFLLNQSEWHFFTVHKKIIPQHKQLKREKQPFVL